MFYARLHSSVIEWMIFDGGFYAPGDIVHAKVGRKFRRYRIHRVLSPFRGLILPCYMTLGELTPDGADPVNGCEEPLFAPISLVETMQSGDLPRPRVGQLLAKRAGKLYLEGGGMVLANLLSLEDTEFMREQAAGVDGLSDLPECSRLWLVLRPSGKVRLCAPGGVGGFDTYYRPAVDGEGS